MSILDEPPEIKIQNPKMSLSAKEVEQIRDFIRNNREALSKLADGEIDAFDFKDNMVVCESCNF